MRSIETHSCPIDEKQLYTALAAAVAGSTSSSTIIGFLPPSSSEAPTSRSAARTPTLVPVSVEPVKHT